MTKDTPRGAERDRRSRGVAVVTGGSAGVGRATVRLLARRGYDVGILARGEDGLEAAAAEVESLGGRALAISADVADAEAVQRAARRIDSTIGPIEVWINNAMTTVFAPVRQIAPAEYERATQVTYLGTVWGTMAALSCMRPRNRGTIVQVGSALAYRAIPLQAPYCGAKHAIRGFTDSLRTELLHDRSRIRLSMVQLPALNTPQFTWCEAKLPRQPQPVPPIYQPEVAAQGIVFAAESRRREVWVGAPTYQTILGQKVAPGLLDRYLARNGWEAQQTDQPADPDRPSNLFEPVPGDHGARGPFHDRSRTWSPALELSEKRGWIAAGLALLAGAGYVASRRGR